MAAISNDLRYDTLTNKPFLTKTEKKRQHKIELRVKEGLRRWRTQAKQMLLLPYDVAIVTTAMTLLNLPMSLETIAVRQIHQPLVSTSTDNQPTEQLVFVPLQNMPVADLFSAQDSYLAKLEQTQSTGLISASHSCSSWTSHMEQSCNNGSVVITVRRVVSVKQEEEAIEVKRMDIEETKVIDDEGDTESGGATIERPSTDLHLFMQLPRDPTSISVDNLSCFYTSFSCEKGAVFNLYNDAEKLLTELLNRVKEAVAIMVSARGTGAQFIQRIQTMYMENPYPTVVLDVYEPDLRRYAPIYKLYTSFSNYSSTGSITGDTNQQEIPYAAPDSEVAIFVNGLTMWVTSTLYEHQERYPAPFKMDYHGKDVTPHVSVKKQLSYGYLISKLVYECLISDVIQALKRVQGSEQ